jgi:anti-sigma factor RsiW
MTCEESKPLLGSYIDGELDLVHSLEVERHIAGCAACAAAQQNLLALRSVVQEKTEYFRAPQSLRQSVRAIAGANPAAIATAKNESTEARRGVFPSRRLTWNWMGAAAAFALFLVVGLRVTNLWGPSQENLLTGEIESAHVRSLMANHLTDVVSTDQHTVKPWFHGKLDFSPPVQDFSSEGFPLIGGRLDYIHGRTVASLVYQRREHPINLFVWPAPGEKDSDVHESARDGYNVLHWTRGGMSYWSVSDLALDEMLQFANLQRR